MFTARNAIGWKIRHFSAKGNLYLRSGEAVVAPGIPSLRSSADRWGIRLL